MELVIGVAVIGIGGFALYGVLHGIRDFADRQRAAVWAVVALLAAGGMAVLHFAGHVAPHIVIHESHLISPKP